ncbi:hypothetical protein NQ315_005692 [Exocentrus adspersus]|uniref:Uncharacterized protein n=1 Tax=Exocentrus adspersus TaxID=1586481 RepID=A0AAV8VIR7_9CUCU|nr:hypothetical protein NQ315_005692 [Exocentrus adspersus]
MKTKGYRVRRKESERYREGEGFSYLTLKCVIESTEMELGPIDQCDVVQRGANLYTKDLSEPAKDQLGSKQYRPRHWSEGDNKDDKEQHRT